MKRLFTVILSVLIMIVLFGCSPRLGENERINKEGVYPYPLSESDTYLLESLDLEKNVNRISFKAPQAAKSLKVQSYVLDENGKWDTISELHILSGNNDNSQSELEGTFSMLLKDDYSIDMHITAKGRFSQKGSPLDIESEFLASSRGFLTEYEEIELNKEIPVTIMIYDNGSINPYSMDDFFTPSTFEGMDLVQAVTLTFTGKVD